MNKNLELKSIGEILGNHFLIPSYQRGYRWDERQVEDLLDDIYEFANQTKTKDEFYCLQPIVVKKETIEKQDKFRIIDGQQRLTSIYIILKYFENLKSEFEVLKKNCDKIEEYVDIENFDIEKVYLIEYETRSDSKEFLENKLHDGIDNSNPDYYYMSRAYEKIKEWFKDKQKKLFLDTLLEKTKVIWYEIDEQEDENNIFTRLNIGKIPLTNAELIKAMLLIPIKDYKEQIEFSTLWDEVEQTLRDRNFWYFLTNQEMGDTAIDLIFFVLAKKYKQEFKIEISNLKEDDNKFSYYIFDNALKNDNKTEQDIWSDTQQYFRYFLDWFNDREMYHKVGYLVSFTSDILELIGKYEKNTKDKFKELLDNKIKNKLKNLNLTDLEYGDKKIKEVLLLFNIETILQNPNSNQRFDFKSYKEKSWDIEHIASQTDNVNKEEWVKSVLLHIKGIKKPSKNKLKLLVDNFENYQEKIKNKLNIKDLDEDLKDAIGNLTLLDSKTNRSYGNAFYPLKRAIIINEDSQGNFIPPATKNVFLKQYSNKLSDMMNWNEDDIKAYQDAILKLLKEYGIKNGDSNEKN